MIDYNEKYDQRFIKKYRKQRGLSQKEFVLFISISKNVDISQREPFMTEIGSRKN